MRINAQYNYPWANKAVEGTYIQLVNNAGMLLYVLPVLVLCVPAEILH